MATPIILIDSATGSDTLASGAGPATALTGSAASTSSDGLTVTLDGSPSLTGVATDGSHAIFLSDTTTGARNFGSIVGKDDTAKTVTIATGQAFGLSLTGKAWAIGGRRASLGATTSRKLAENNSLAGDAMPGWVLELQSGHSETLSATITFRRPGDTGLGSIFLRGVANYTVMPLLMFSNNGNMIAIPNTITGLGFLDFELQNTNATKTASVGITFPNGSPTGSQPSYNRLARLRIIHSTNRLWKGIIFGGISARADSCEVAYCASHGLSGLNGALILDCFVHDNGGDGIAITANSAWVSGCIVVRNAGSGYSQSSSVGGLRLLANTFHANGTGLSVAGTTAPFQAQIIENNQITGSTSGYGINFSSTPTQTNLDAGFTVIRNNNFGSGATANSLGACSLASAVADPSNISVDPGYADATGNNFSPGANVEGMGFPTTTIANGWSSTRSRVAIGVAQPTARYFAY